MLIYLFIDPIIHSLA